MFKAVLFWKALASNMKLFDSRRSVAIHIITFFFSSLASAAPVMHVAISGLGKQNAIPFAQFFEDATGRLTLGDAQETFARSADTVTHPNRDAMSLGFSGSSFWLRLELKNDTSDAVSQLLEVSNARISNIALYQQLANGVWIESKTGSDLPFSKRPIENRNFVFPVSIPAQSSSVLYLKAQSNIGAGLPLSLWAESDFAKHVRNDYMLQSIYLGIALTMALFNTLLYLSLRDKAYAYYVAFVLFSVLSLTIKTGIASEFLFPQFVAWNDEAYFASVSWAVIFFVALMRNMLRLERRIPKIDKGLKSIMLLHLFLSLAYWGNLPALLIPVLFVFGATLLYLIGVTLWCSALKVRVAYFFGGAFAMLMLGASMTLLRVLGWLPTNTLTMDGLQMGSSIEMFLLAFALADRYHQMRRQKHSAQKALVEGLKASERDLTKNVEIRTAELLKLNQKLEALSMVDGLTGIANRRQFDQVLNKEWMRSERTGQPLALVMLDVDWFKRYNDQFGHQAGDECLRRVAQAIQSISRSSDLVARYGGEEFVIVSPETDGKQALHVAQRACDAVRSLSIPHPHSEFGTVSLSCGVCVAVANTDSSPSDLIGNADDALYQAKAQGRNRSVLSLDSVAGS
jgi:two-component system, sensor histidine kinase LadS